MLETITLCLLIAITGLLWAVVNHQRSQEAKFAPLERLDDIRNQVGRLVESGAELDLRRIEHVLIDIRDGQKRLEEKLLVLAETNRGAVAAGAEPAPERMISERSSGASVAERIHNRLLAMGFERIQLLNTIEEIGELLESDGAVSVEARRAGAACKGRVTLRDGIIGDVDLKTTHAMFP
jgi:hypothetical protein